MKQSDMSKRGQTPKRPKPDRTAAGDVHRLEALILALVVIMVIVLKLA